MNSEKQDKDDESIDISKGIPSFVVKSIVVSLSLVASLTFLMPELPKIPETEQNKLLLLSFINNPYVLWRLSELQEEKSKKDNAIQYMEAALGLMEMHNASEKSQQKYRDRLERLKAK